MRSSQNQSAQSFQTNKKTESGNVQDLLNQMSASFDEIAQILNDARNNGIWTDIIDNFPELTGADPPTNIYSDQAPLENPIQSNINTPKAAQPKNNPSPVTNSKVSAKESKESNQNSLSESKNRKAPNQHNSPISNPRERTKKDDKLKPVDSKTPPSDQNKISPRKSYPDSPKSQQKSPLLKSKGLKIETKKPESTIPKPSPKKSPTEKCSFQPSKKSKLPISPSLFTDPSKIKPTQRKAPHSDAIITFPTSKGVDTNLRPNSKKKSNPKPFSH